MSESSYERKPIPDHMARQGRTDRPSPCGIHGGTRTPRAESKPGAGPSWSFFPRHFSPGKPAVHAAGKLTGGFFWATVLPPDRLCRRVDNRRVNSAPQSPPIPTPTEPGDERQAPASLTEIFIAFTQMALQGFGGVLAVVQREMVERRRWMSRDEFVEEWAVAQVMPGPNVINLAIIFGLRHFGWRGALVGIAGLLTAPTCVVLSLTLLYAQFAHVPQVQAALRGMGGVTAGLIAATGLKLMPTLARHPLGWRLAAVFSVLTFIGLALLRLPLVWLLLALGGPSCYITWRRLGAGKEAGQ